MKKMGLSFYGEKSSEFFGPPNEFLVPRAPLQSWGSWSTEPLLRPLLLRHKRWGDEEWERNSVRDTLWAWMPGSPHPPEPPPARRCPVPKAAEALSAVWGHLQEGWGQTCQLEPFLPNYTRSWTRPLCFSALLFVYCWYSTWFYILRSNWHTTLS